MKFIVTKRVKAGAYLHKICMCANICRSIYAKTHTVCAAAGGACGHGSEELAITLNIPLARSMAGVNTMVEIHGCSLGWAKRDRDLHIKLHVLTYMC